ncbi:MAG TPA: 4Fe-4S dicluster domain-containing protein [Dokdonella sp.]|uniref:4Fe-4S dicluster domain-containing protein n=1 Tax=Dokdonella sp. TaxID=2291710 RepID=UPI0025C53755|nr:4Fe-4S dicluster domain-containing protein [Dokdonella sp.]MBX3691184.1 4Fe-4S dicluster domain-containing protein [Dokdonella sp.]MCW5566985.1 4Fe-4S dicluster domain-containing protein [Dokdonella sp.]HNR91003.1 4Fe-4S dicluster domain-containing protein [Dokdonella sp.]
MTSLPPPAAKKLGLVIDLDTCVGCHACAVACKEWNDGGAFGPLIDENAYAAEPFGVWFNRVHSYAVEEQGFGIREKSRVGSSCAPASPNPQSPISNPGLTIHFPRSCLHCETPACVTVCPTGASYKRAEDGIVLVDEDKCIGCQLCAWACPYGAREFSARRGTMQKCTLCVDRIYNETLDEADRQPACVLACPTRARHFGDLGDETSAVSKLVAEREGYALMPELGYKPVNRYLPPRPRRDERAAKVDAQPETVDHARLPPLLRWLDRTLSR